MLSSNHVEVGGMYTWTCIAVLDMVYRFFLYVKTVDLSLIV